MAAGHVAAAAVAVSSTSDNPVPQPNPSDPDPVLPASKPSTPAISMTAALKNVGAVSIPLVSLSHCIHLSVCMLLGYFQFAFCLIDHSTKRELDRDRDSISHTGESVMIRNGMFPDGLIERMTVVHAVLPLQQKEKKQILRRLNLNLRGQSSAEELEELLPPAAEPSTASQTNQPETENAPSSNGDRKKWEAAELPLLAVAQQTLEETCGTTTRTLSFTMHLIYPVC